MTSGAAVAVAEPTNFDAEQEKWWTSAGAAWTDSAHFRWPLQRRAPDGSYLLPRRGRQLCGSARSRSVRPCPLQLGEVRWADRAGVPDAWSNRTSFHESSNEPTAPTPGGLTRVRQNLLRGSRWVAVELAE